MCKGVTAGRVLVLIQAASLRSAFFVFIEQARSTALADVGNDMYNYVYSVKHKEISAFVLTFRHIYRIIVK